MANNTTIGVLENITTNTTAREPLKLNETSNMIGDLAISSLGGSYEIGGIVGLSIMGFLIYKSDVDKEVAGVISVPTVIFMAYKGLLPYSRGILAGMIILVAAMFTFGIIKWADN